MVRALEGSLYNGVPDVCHGLLWVKENQERGTDTRNRWKDKIMEWHHGEKVRTLVRCGDVLVGFEEEIRQALQVRL